MLGGQEEVTIVAGLVRDNLKEFSVEKGRSCALNPAGQCEVGYKKILEVAVNRDVLDLNGQSKFTLGVALWHSGLPIDVLPAEGYLDVQLGEENAAWSVEK